MSSRVIAVSGWKSSGKDTFAHHLVSEYGYEQLSFAAALKDLVAKQYHLHRTMMDDPQLKEEPLLQFPVITTDKFTQLIHEQLASELKSGYWTPRALCILEGSLKRSVNANFWVARVVETIKQNPKKKYVISDLRYCSEADTLKILLPENELTLVRITRHSDVGTNDPSERDLDQYKFHVGFANMGTVQAYKEAIDMYMHVTATLEQGN